jgi:hypothetical protein
MKDLDTVFDLVMGDEYIQIVSNLSPKNTIERLRMALPKIAVSEEQEKAWLECQKMADKQLGDLTISLKEDMFEIDGGGSGPKRREDN